ncbi:MAG: hypothetical protein EBS19_00950 [Spirochaetia bacterium]|nr:hypothetical protein [Spirochaetia bacterium]
MNENISRTEAHKVFANLYRKTRSPEHQAKVDEIITRSNDVFIRIDLIKKLDEDFEKSSRQTAEKKSSSGGSSTSNVSNTSSSESEKKATPAKKDAPKPQPLQPLPKNDGGLIDRIFGAGGQIGKFAKESKAIDLGLLGRKPTVSPNVEKIFKTLKEEEIIATAQALKFCEQAGWRIWTPLDYNIVVNFGRFFSAFISLDTLFKDEISPEVFLGRSTKMQMYYARIISNSNTKDIILDKVPGLIKLDTKLAPKLEFIMKGLSYILALESRRPTLKDAIIAYHIVLKKKYVPWEEIEKSLSIAPIEETKFNSTPEITKQIDMASAKIYNDITTKLNGMEEIQTIKKTYFTFKSDGEVDYDFTEGVLNDYMSHYMPESSQNDSVKQSIAQSPPRLLQVLCRDIQSIYIPLIEGFIKVDYLGTVKDASLVQTGLFFPEIDKITATIRSLEGFNKKFPSFSYTFKKYSDDLHKGTTDQLENQLLKMISEASEFFGKFAKKLTVIIEADRLAQEHERNGMLNEKILGTKEKPIDEIKLMQRFIPFGKGKIVSQNRLNGRLIQDVLFELTSYLYKYAVMFKDPMASGYLMSFNEIEQSLKKMYAEYERLACKPYAPPGQEMV